MASMTWVDCPDDHPFGVMTQAFGVFSRPGQAPRVGVRVGEYVLDVVPVAAIGKAAGRVEPGGLDLSVTLDAPNLNPLLALGRPAWQATREWLFEILTDDVHRAAVEPHLIPLEQCILHLPIEVGDYVDFYASEHHATNVGRIFRPDSEPLTPNWKHLPIGYHGRSGTVVVSGTDVVRPCGQRKAPSDPVPVFGASVKLDIEAELGFVVGGSTAVGQPVPLDRAHEHLFGVVVLNDWSARDLQAWEYVPLGPFLGKSFATSISAWVVPLEALSFAERVLPQQDPHPLPYLHGTPDVIWGLEVHLEVVLNGTVVSRPEYVDMYWSPTQMLAHLTVNGASVRPGDLFGSGTISGVDPGTRGSLLELTWNGTEPISLADGTTRTFLQDGDGVVLRAWAPGPEGTVIGLGEVRGRIVPAHTTEPSGG